MRACFRAVQTVLEEGWKVLARLGDAEAAVVGFRLIWGALGQNESGFIA